MGGFKYPTGGFDLGKPMMDPNAGMTTDSIKDMTPIFGNVKEQGDTIMQNRIATQDYVSGRTYPELINQYNKTGIYMAPSSGGTLSAPKHVEQARAAALSNPIGSLVEGTRVIGGGIASLFKGNNQETTMKKGGYRKLKKRKKRIYG